MVIASDGSAVLAHGRAAEFAAPDDERILEHAALFEIEQQSGGGAVHFAAAQLDGIAEIVRFVAVMIPVGVVELHETHAALHEPAGHQAIVGEGRLAGFGSVLRQGRGRRFTL